MPKRKTGAYLQGIIRLIKEATIGITDLTEAMHKQVVHPPLLPSTPIQDLITNIAGLTYKNIKWSAKFIGDGIDKALTQLTPLLSDIKTVDGVEAIQAALNGLIGDYLEEKENPLGISMQFRYQSKVIVLDSKSINITYPKINGNILLMVHGSCMNDIQWTRKEHNHGLFLAEELNKTPVFLHYNSGRHISSNGQNFNELLEALVMHWPIKVEELSIVAHSMGGLVTRSALYYGQQQKKLWVKDLKKIVFLGTPHHGAPLEQAGNYLDTILESIPYSKPFARLGKIRSAGITDLRYGNLIDEDWQEQDRFELLEDKRLPIPLPKKIECYSIAAIHGKESNTVSSKLIGDGLVNVQSALGQHKDASRKLHFKKKNTLVVYEASHLDLLNNTEVYTKLKMWLS